MPLGFKTHTINYNYYKKNDNVIFEKDIYIYLYKGNIYVNFTDPEKKKLLLEIINTDKGLNLYKKLFQKETLNMVVNKENMYKIKATILKLLNDLIKQSKYSNFLENE